LSHRISGTFFILASELHYAKLLRRNHYLTAKESEMLVLSRKLDQEITIYGNIVVKVAGIQGNQVRLAISAPREIPVHRSEIAEIVASFHEPAEGNRRRQLAASE
jgi:carbon storage regulator